MRKARSQGRLPNVEIDSKVVASLRGQDLPDTFRDGLSLCLEKDAFVL